MAEHLVVIRDFAFDPGEIKIANGDTVTWSNEDTDTHTATSSSGAPVEFDTGAIESESRVSHTFEHAELTAEIEYFCQIHPSMTAKIVIA